MHNLIYACIQAVTEFLPVSSSGHLALASNIIGTPDVALFAMLHLASAIAVIFFLRREIIQMLSFKKEYRPLWLYCIIATIPGAIFGYLLKDAIEMKFMSFLFLGIAFIFTAFVLFMTKFTKNSGRLDHRTSFVIGICQVLALFPGISRSGMTISTGLFLGLEKESAAKFSFLLSVPLCVGAFILESRKLTYDLNVLISFLVCIALSFICLKLIMVIVNMKKFWLFSFYCLAVGIFSLAKYFTK